MSADYDVDEAAREWFGGDSSGRPPRELRPLDERLRRLPQQAGELVAAARDLQKSARRLRAAAGSADQ